MESAHDSACRATLVVLNEVNAADFFVKFTFGVTFKEVASRVGEDAWLDDYHSVDVGSDYIHFFERIYDWWVNKCRLGDSV